MAQESTQSPQHPQMDAEDKIWSPAMTRQPEARSVRVTPLPPYSPAKTEATISTDSSTTDTRLQNDRILLLPCIDIEQNGNGKSECDLLLDMLDSLRQQWHTAHPAMEHLKTSLITTIAIWDQPRAYYASLSKGGEKIYRVVGRFRRHRPGKHPIDLCLVLWKEMYISEREKALLRDTHRYRVKEICGPDERLGVVRVKWCASWEPVQNLPRHLQGLDAFSADIVRARMIGDDIPDFEIEVGSYDSGPYCGCDLHPFDD